MNAPGHLFLARVPFLDRCTNYIFCSSVLLPRFNINLIAFDFDDNISVTAVKKCMSFIYSSLVEWCWIFYL